MKYILGVNKTNFLVYVLELVVSIIFIGLYFCECISECFRNVLMSIGASCIGAVVLAFSIELNNNKLNNKLKNRVKENAFHNLYNRVLNDFEKVCFQYFKCRNKIAKDIDGANIIDLKTANTEIFNFFKGVDDAKYKEEIDEMDSNLLDIFENLKKTLDYVIKERPNYEISGVIETDSLNKICNAYTSMIIMHDNCKIDCASTIIASLSMIGEITEFKELYNYIFFYNNVFHMLIDKMTNEAVSPYKGNKKAEIESACKTRNEFVCKKDYMR